MQKIEGFLGPQEVGVMVAILLLSLVTTQAFTYFRTYPDDPKGIKVLVGIVWVLLFAFTITNTFSLYRRTVIDYGHLTDLEQYPEGMCGTFAVSGLIGVIVQVNVANASEKYPSVPHVILMLRLAVFYLSLIQAIWSDSNWRHLLNTFFWAAGAQPLHIYNDMSGDRIGP